jgi:hypothetical protein
MKEPIHNQFIIGLIFTTNVAFPSSSHALNTMYKSSLSDEIIATSEEGCSQFQ